MGSIIYGQINMLQRTVATLNDNMTDIQKRLGQMEMLASPEKAEELRQIVHIVKSDISGMDERLASHQKQLERFVENMDRANRDDMKKELQREKMLLETLLTQKLEQNLLKLMKEKIDDVKVDMAMLRSQTDEKLADLHKVLSTAVMAASEDNEAEPPVVSEGVEPSMEAPLSENTRSADDDIEITIRQQGRKHGRGGKQQSSGGLL